MDVKKMTTQEKMSFEERLFKKAWDLAGQKAHFESELSLYRLSCIECGRWAREETIREVMCLLRSGWEDGGAAYIAAEAEVRGPEAYADWLDKKLAQNVHPQLTDKPESEPKVVMKDEIYKTDGDE